MKPGHSLMKHYLQFKDLRAEEYVYLFERARIIKTRFKNYEKYQPLADRTLAMRAGVETLRIMEEDGVMANAAAVGQVLREALQAGLKGEKGVVEFRGQGLMIGIELDRPCGVLLGRAAEAGLLISVTADRVVRLLPPLILSTDEARQIAAILCPLIKAFLAEPT